MTRPPRTVTWCPVCEAIYRGEDGDTCVYCALDDTPGARTVTFDLVPRGGARVLALAERISKSDPGDLVVDGLLYDLTVALDRMRARKNRSKGR